MCSFDDWFLDGEDMLSDVYVSYEDAGGWGMEGLGNVFCPDAQRSFLGLSVGFVFLLSCRFVKLIGSSKMYVAGWSTFVTRCIEKEGYL